MWLLDTHRTELKNFPDSRTAPGFAILSHTWSSAEPEQTFQQVRDIYAWCEESGQNPREHVSDKIRNCCIIAERDGYEWVWIDSCCIDKSSSTELSEAINSMFDWYVLAEVCYVYLDDVHTNPEEDDSEFLAARWYTRGWTLQELLAPAVLVFLSADWKPIGTKHSLSLLVSKATGIPERYVTRKRDMFRAPVGQRMSWASRRKTTRVEDEAYCLLGIFSINMPTLYGEGQRAFQRLQLEIVKQSQDTTLLAWGGLDDGLRDPVRPSIISSRDPSTAGTTRFLLALSPSAFILASNNYYTPRLSSSGVLQPYLPSQWSDKHKSEISDTEDKQKTGPFGTIELPSFKATSYGMECRFPVGEVDGITIAVLLAETMDQHVGLFLRPAPEGESLDPTHRLYYTSWSLVDPEGGSSAKRMTLLGNNLYNLRFRGKPIHASWKTIHIRTGCDGPSDRTDVAWTVFQGMSDESSPTSFRLPSTVIAAMSALGFRFASGGLLCRKSESEPQVWYDFFSSSATEKIIIRVGACVISDRRFFWAYVSEQHTDTWGIDDSHSGHDCATDHIADWPNQTRVFGHEPDQRKITLWFADCPHTPETVVFHPHLAGGVYEEMLRETKVTFPSPPSVVSHTSAVEKHEISPTPPTLSSSTEIVALHKFVPDKSPEHPTKDLSDSASLPSMGNIVWILVMLMLASASSVVAITVGACMQGICFATSWVRTGVWLTKRNPATSGAGSNSASITDVLANEQTSS